MNTASIAAKTLAITTLNISGPSPERAQRQLEWLAERDDDLFVLTETRPAKGLELLARWFRSAGWQVCFPIPEDTDRGVMIASRINLLAGTNSPVSTYLPWRLVNVGLETEPRVGLIGVYVPSRDASEVKTTKKRRYASALQNVLGLLRSSYATLILAGDLNILERDHHPYYQAFQEWEYTFYEGMERYGLIDAFRHLHPKAREYSWVGRTGEGYRYDHMFVSREISDRIKDCSYIHATRQNGLSDHSALRLTIAVDTKSELRVSRLISHEPTLF